MTPELQTRIALAEKYGDHPDQAVRDQAGLLRAQIRSARGSDSEAMRETIQLSFVRLQTLVAEAERR